MNQQQCLDAIAEGQGAYDLLYAVDPKLIKRFYRLTNQMLKYLNDVKVHFPDATYYTASGGFNLLLGASHSDDEQPQQQLVAVGACNGLQVGDGDF